MKMAKKKAQGSMGFIIKVVVIILIFIILGTTLNGMFNKAKKAIMDVVDKQYEEFNVMDGVLYHPDLPSEYVYFWNQGLREPIKAAVAANTPCLGSFYSNKDLNLKGAQIRLVQTEDKGITMYMTNAKGVVVIYDEQVLPDKNLKLCVVDEPKSLSELYTQIKNGLDGKATNFSYNENTKIIKYKPVEDLYIQMDNLENDKDGVEVGFYVDKAVLGKHDPKNLLKFLYPAYFPGKNPNYPSSVERIERYHFFFFVNGENFCIVRTEKDQGFWPRDVKQYISDLMKNKKNVAFLDQTSNNPLCPAPADLFESKKSSYYLGCAEFANSDFYKFCPQSSEGQKGLCLWSGDPSVTCASCQLNIKKCDDYNDFSLAGKQRSDLCNRNPCKLEGGCSYVKNKCAVKEV